MELEFVPAGYSVERAWHLRRDMRLILDEDSEPAKLQETVPDLDWKMHVGDRRSIHLFDAIEIWGDTLILLMEKDAGWPANGFWLCDSLLAHPDLLRR